MECPSAQRAGSASSVGARSCVRPHRTVIGGGSGPSGAVVAADVVVPRRSVRGWLARSSALDSVRFPSDIPLGDSAVIPAQLRGGGMH